MLRLTEAVLFATPFVVFVLWRCAFFHRASRRVLALASLSVAALALGLIWYGLGRSLPADRPYVPARLNASGDVVSP
jgi:hypothetical protein